ncbi:hypothetical protein EWB00_010392 [Schistosoma japonicum]|uniref:Uncharacterized protein n=1 Tax=Schistosoma japonicum TaxID=6182 RepID=A0A4Z2DXM5_SCHJA|nr:hypothetical protein EWB00_010392 [Schistosoma japonicum]
MVDLWKKLFGVTLCLQIILCESEIKVPTAVNVTRLFNTSTNTTPFANPIKSLSLHFCPSARANNKSGINGTGLQNRSEITQHIPIQQLVPPNHELKSISINFDAKCLPKLNLPQVENKDNKTIEKIEKPEQQNVTNERITTTIPKTNRETEEVKLNTQSGDRTTQTLDLGELVNVTDLLGRVVGQQRVSTRQPTTTRPVGKCQ